MVRDFSREKREELYKALDTMDEREWKPFLEWCGGRAEEFGEWAERLGISSHMRQVDNFQDRILEVNDSARNQIEAVFEGVAEMDRRYAETFRGHVETVKGQIKRVQVMLQAMQSADGDSLDANLLLHGRNPQPGVPREELVERGQRVLRSYLRVRGITDPAEQQKVCGLIMERQPGMLVSLYLKDYHGDEDASTTYSSIVNYYHGTQLKDIDYIIEKISENDVCTHEEMFSLNTYDLLARMIYQEMQNPVNGEQNEVLWATMNRYFSDKNFTRGGEKTLRSILEEGKYASIDKNHKSKFNAYHPDYNSEGWKNAKRLAAILYAQIGEANADDVDEEKVREAVSASQDIYGKNIENTIGNCNSFHGDGKKNHFYEL